MWTRKEINFSATAGNLQRRKNRSVIRDHAAIPKEAKDYILKLRQKYNLPDWRKQS